MLRYNPAIVLMGPRQVGKTTLALEIASQRKSVYLDLERPSDLAKISDIESFCDLNETKLLIFDEVQLAPNLLAPLRGVNRRSHTRRRSVGAVPLSRVREHRTVAPIE